METYGQVVMSIGGNGITPHIVSHAMRISFQPQIPLPRHTAKEHEHVQEVRAMGEILDQIPEVVGWVHQDLLGPTADPNKGREGMTAEQVLRVLIIKQITGLTYERLAFTLADSINYQEFCRFGAGQPPPRKSALQSNVKRVRAETIERINRKVLEVAKVRGVENGTKVRADCTVIESNIHEPSDSSLLWDSVRVVTRLMREARELLPEIQFTDHSRRAKRRSIEIQYAKNNDNRAPLYRDLLKVTHWTIEHAEGVSLQLAQTEFGDLMVAVQADAIRSELAHYIDLAKKVCWQTERRVLDGESVPASEKIVSIFEPHTHIIIKKNRETLYGHKVSLSSGVSGLILDMVVQQGNPADSSLATTMMDRHREIYGKAPRQAAFDGGFSSRANLEQLKAKGIKDVVFSKGRGLAVLEMAKSSWVYKQLRNFRAGIESGISFLKRVFGWDRCTWSGLSSFKAYSWSSVLACNLLVLARHSLG